VTTTTLLPRSTMESGRSPMSDSTGPTTWTDRALRPAGRPASTSYRLRGKGEPVRLTLPVWRIPQDRGALRRGGREQAGHYQQRSAPVARPTCQPTAADLVLGTQHAQFDDGRIGQVASCHLFPDEHVRGRGRLR
jgi:hypothetical protein